MPPIDTDRGAAIWALIVDYGGVLTTSVAEFTTAWERADGVAPGLFAAVLRDWLGPAAGIAALGHPIYALERGEMEIPDFERRLAARLRRSDGRPVSAEGLLDRLFAAIRPEPLMVDLVRRVRATGRRTALLSNSWGLNYPRDDWADLFDVTVISAEVGMRKPEADIFAHTAAALQVPPNACVFVDDLPGNVEGAVAAGMVGVLHRSPGETIRQLAELLGVVLPPPGEAASGR